MDLRLIEPKAEEGLGRSLGVQTFLLCSDAKKLR